MALKRCAAPRVTRYPGASMRTGYGPWYSLVAGDVLLGRLCCSWEGFFEDAERVQEEIWSLVDPGGVVVVDVGVGDSTRRLLEQGATVVGC